MGKLEKVDLLLEWKKSLRIWHMAHSRAATMYSARGRLLGLLVVLFSAIVGTSLVADLTTSLGRAWELTGIFLSAAATVLAAIQTYMNYPEKCEKHRLIAQQFGALRRSVEQEIELPPSDLDKSLDEIRKRWDMIEKEAPSIPQKIYDKSKKDVEARMKEEVPIST